MIKYYKVEEIYHSKIDTDTLEFEMFAIKLNRFLYRRAIEESGFITLCLNSQEHGRVEITEKEYLEAKEEFKTKL